MTREQAIDKMRKIKALIDNSDGGEKQAAEEALKRIMESTGIKEDELLIEASEFKYIKIGGIKSWELFKQMAYIRFGIKRMGYFGADCKTENGKNLRRLIKNDPSVPKGVNVVVFCKPSDAVLAQYTYDLLQQSLNQHIEGMFYAFLDRNELLAPPDPNNTNAGMSEEERSIASRMLYSVRRADINPALNQ